MTRIEQSLLDADFVVRQSCAPSLFEAVADIVVPLSVCQRYNIVAMHARVWPSGAILYILQA